MGCLDLPCISYHECIFISQNPTLNIKLSIRMLMQIIRTVSKCDNATINAPSVLMHSLVQKPLETNAMLAPSARFPFERNPHEVFTS